MGESNVWSTAHLPTGDGRAAGVTVNGLELSCEIPADLGPEPAGATPFGLLAGSLSACTAMSVRTFLQLWDIEPGEVTVHVGFRTGSPPMMDRRVTVEAEVSPDLREQLASVVDHTPVTVLLRDALTIRTELTTGAA
ncbi:OsmC family protein [Pseudonocardia sp. CA-142604]|uniref:OsmC family protein n=1 Tax=Pseudonocardia sp. CA-142604 TaxID=3240024 RepID=UPI003D908866